MNYRTIEYTEKEHIAIINLRDMRYNNSAIDLSYELSEVCSAIVTRDDIYTVVLSGIASGLVSSEADFITGVSDYDKAGYVEAFPVAESVANIDKPVIAAIDGEAYNQALEIFLACDLRIASEGSRFGFQQIKDGLIPWNGGTQRLARLAGKAKALEMILTGMVIDSAEAYRIGLINKLVSGNEIKDTVIEIAREITNKGPVALRYAKEAINAGMDLTLEQGLHLEADLYMLLHTSEDRTEGIKAFREKRKPLFHAR